MSDRAFGFMALFVFVPGLIWIIAHELRTGKIWSRYGPDFRREKQPILFWLSVVIYSVIATIMLLVGLHMLGWS